MVPNTNDNPSLPAELLGLLNALHQPALVVDGRSCVLAANVKATSQLGDVFGKPLADIAWPDEWVSAPNALVQPIGNADTPVRTVALGEATLVLLPPLMTDDALPGQQLHDVLIDADRQQMMAYLSAGTAHEINNPLGGIMQSIQLLQRAIQLDDPRTRDKLVAAGIDEAGLDAIKIYIEHRRFQRFADIIQDCGERITDLVKQVLGFARHAEPTIVRHPTGDLIDRALFLADCENELKKRYGFREIERSRDNAADLIDAECDWPSVVHVLVRLLKIITERIAARKERDQDFSPSIALQSVSEGAKITITLRGNGEALSADELAALEKAPELLPTRDTALQLSVCQALLRERSNGNLQASSHANETVFQISLNRPNHEPERS